MIGKFWRSHGQRGDGTSSTPKPLPGNPSFVAQIVISTWDVCATGERGGNAEPSVGSSGEWHMSGRLSRRSKTAYLLLYRVREVGEMIIVMSLHRGACFKLPSARPS